jgi:hypothetical protein
MVVLNSRALIAVEETGLRSEPVLEVPLPSSYESAPTLSHYLSVPGTV